MAVPALKYAIGNGASTTISTSMTGASTSVDISSTTNFQAAPTPGEGTVLIDEGTASEEIAYATGISSSTLSIPLANRGLEGTSAASHTANVSTIKGVLTQDMWNDLITAVANVLDRTTGAVDGTKVAKISSNDALLPAASSNIQVNSTDPKRGIYIPAASMYPATTNGADIGQIETSTNKINVKVFDFDASTEQYTWFCMPAPSYWDLGTVTAEFHWTAASGSGDVIWGLAGLARSDDDAMDTALGTAQEVTDTLLSANDEHLTSDTSAITIGGSPAKDDFLYFRVYRKAAAGGDTLGVDARLKGVTIRFSIGQYDDQ